MIVIRALKQSSVVSGLLTAVLVCVAGCDYNARVIDKQHEYILAARRVSAAPRSPGKGVLKVRRFSLSSPFETHEFVYRKTNLEYTSDYYNRFFAPPADLIAEETHRWLGASGVFANVIESFSSADYDFMLEGDVKAVYGDSRGQSDPNAVMEIKFLLIDQHLKRDAIIFSTEYRSVQPTGDDTAPALVEGFNACLAEILTNLEADLRRLPQIAE